MSGQPCPLLDYANVIKYDDKMRKYASLVDVGTARHYANSMFFVLQS